MQTREGIFKSAYSLLGDEALFSLLHYAALHFDEDEVSWIMDELKKRGLAK